MAMPVCSFFFSSMYLIAYPFDVFTLLDLSIHLVYLIVSGRSMAILVPSICVSIFYVFFSFFYCEWAKHGDPGTLYMYV